MKGFSFKSTAGASQPTTRTRLEGNTIHTVKFDGCEALDYSNGLYKVLKLKFSNEDGVFEHTIFEPKEEDSKRSSKDYTDKNGKIQEIISPSNIENMMLLIKHLLDTVNPELSKKIDDGEVELEAPNWDGFRKLLVKIFEKPCEKTFQIKLLKNKKGEAILPGFFSSVARESGVAYVKDGFIGTKVGFTPYEVKRINNEATATVTKVSKVEEFDAKVSEETTVESVGIEDFTL